MSFKALKLQVLHQYCICLLAYQILLLKKKFRGFLPLRWSLDGALSLFLVCPGLRVFSLGVSFHLQYTVQLHSVSLNGYSLDHHSQEGLHLLPAAESCGVCYSQHQQRRCFLTPAGRDRSLGPLLLRLFQKDCGTPVMVLDTRDSEATEVWFSPHFWFLKLS